MPAPGSEPGDRRFQLELVGCSALVLMLLAALTFLGSQPGRRAFAEEGMTIDLLAEYRSESGAEGVVTLRGTSGGETSVRLTAVAIEPGARYLMVFRARGGASVTVFARGAGRVPLKTWTFRSRRWPREYHRVIPGESLTGNPRLQMVYKGRRDLAVERLSLQRFSRWHAVLEGTIPPLIVLLILAFVWKHRRRLLEGFRRPTRADDRFFALATFALCLFVFLQAPVRQVIDTRYMSVVSRSIVHAGSVALPPNFVPARASRLPYQLQEIGGRIYHAYSPVPAVLNLPFVVAYELFGVSSFRPGGYYDRGAEARVLGMSAAVVSAALCVILYLMARRFLQPLCSLALALAFAFGTQIFSTMSRAYWAHTWGAFLVAGAIYLVLVPWHGREKLSMVAAATLVSWAFFCRPQTALSVLGVTALVLVVHRRRHLWTFLATGIGWAVLGISISMVSSGQILPDFVFAAQSRRMGTDRLVLLWYLRNALGALWSPSRGLLLTVPLLIWVLWIVMTRWRRLPARPMATVALGVISLHYWLLVHTGVWPGGLCFGARQWSDVVVWFFLLAVFAAHAFLTTPRAERRIAWSAQAAVLGLFLAASIFINARGATSWATWNWKAYDRQPAWASEGKMNWLRPGHVWNFRNPQYLAGLLPKDKRSPLKKSKPVEQDPESVDVDPD